MRLLLATHWRATLLILLVATTAAIASTATASFPPPFPLRLGDLADLDGGIPFTRFAESPTAGGLHAVGLLLDWLVVTGWAAALIGTVTILALWGVQAGARGPDLAVHRAIGASRRLLVTGAFGEGLAVAAAALAIGVALGGAAGATAARQWPGEAHSSPALGPAALLIGAAGLLGALLPLWSIRSRRVIERTPVPPPLSIPAVQLGASLAILVAGAMISDRVRATQPANVHRPAATAAVYRVTAGGGSIGERSARYRTLLDSLHGAPNVVASLTSSGGHLGLGTVDDLITDCGQCVVGGIVLKWRHLPATYHTASADTFEARGIRITEGRGLADTDRDGSARVAVVNRYLAARYFEQGHAVGRDVFLGGKMSGPSYRVVGIVDDGRAAGFGAGLEPLEAIYLSTLQHPSTTTELVIAGAGIRAGIAPIAGIGLSEPISGADLARRAALPLEWFGHAFAAEGIAVLFLALVGTGSLMLLWVKALEPELAIRRAVGARRRDVMLLVLREAARTGLLGVGIGLVFFGPAIWPELERMVPGLSYWQPNLVARYAAVLVATAIIASLIPAIRAARANAIALAAGS